MDSEYEIGHVRKLQAQHSQMQKTFANGINNIFRLGRVGIGIQDLYTELADGAHLLQLLELISGEALPAPSPGRLHVHFLENNSHPLAFLRAKAGSMVSPVAEPGCVCPQEAGIEKGFRKPQSHLERDKPKRCLIGDEILTEDWSDGLGFNALLHAHRPDLLDSLSLDHPLHNLSSAFRVAEQELGFAQLLDPEDVAAPHPDERSIMTYLVADLLYWIAEKQMQLEARDFPDSLPAMRHLLAAFASFHAQEKPPRLQQRGAIEALLFQLQTTLRAQNRRPFQPREGLGPAELAQRWADLERAEASRSQAMQHKLLQLELLDTLAHRFQCKAALRESFLNESVQMLDQARDSLIYPATGEAATQRLHMLEVSILPQQGRFQVLGEIADILQQEQYHSWADVARRQKEIAGRWQKLLQCLQEQRKQLTDTRAVLSLLQEVETLQPAEVALLLQRHGLLEAQVSAHRTQVNPLAHHIAQLDASQGTNVQVLQAKALALVELHHSLVSLVRARRTRLEQTLQLAQFLNSSEEEEAWALETELHRHQSVCADLVQKGPNLSVRGPPTQADSLERAEAVLGTWQLLWTEAARRRTRLQSALLVAQYLSDSAKAASWFLLRQKQLESASCWEDQTEALLQRHMVLEQGMHAFGAELSELEDQEEPPEDWSKLGRDTTGEPQGGAQVLAATGSQCSHQQMPFSSREEALNIGELKDLGNSQSRMTVIHSLEQKPQEGPRMALQTEYDFDVDSNTILQAQAHLSQNYENLCAPGKGNALCLRNLHRARLEEAIALLSFYSSYRELQSWLEEQTALFQTLQPQGDNLEAAQLKCENFLMTLAIGKGHWAEVISTAGQLKQRCPGHSLKIRQQEENLNQRWQQLEALKGEKTLQLTHNMEVCRLLQEQAGGSEDSHWTQQKVLVLEKRISYLQRAAMEVLESGPIEGWLLQEQVLMLQDLLKQVQRQLAQRVQVQTEARVQQGILQESQKLLLWAEGIRAQLCSEQQLKDVASAQELLRKLGSLQEETCLWQERLQQLESQGQLVADSDSPQFPEVASALRFLGQQGQQLKALWGQRQQKLQDGLDLQRFAQEVDSFIAACASREASLHLDNLGEKTWGSKTGDDLRETQSLLQQHQGLGWLRSTLGSWAEAQQVRGKKLLLRQHPAEHKIRKLLHSAQTWWTRAQERGEQRRQQLLASLQLQEWKQAVAELMLWMEEKWPPQWPMNPPKHAGRELLRSHPSAQEDTQDRLQGLNHKWEELHHRMAEQGDKLQQTRQQEQLLELLRDVREMLEHLEGALQSTETGQDLCSSLRLQNQHCRLKDKRQALASKMTALISQTHHVSTSLTILEESQRCHQRFKSLQSKLATRHLQLQASVQFYQFNCLSNLELTWVAEHMPSTSPPAPPIAGMMLRAFNVSTSGDAATFGLIRKHQMLQQELALYWSSMEDLEQRFQTLPGFEASEQLGIVREQLQALQKLADARGQEMEGTLKLHEYMTEAEDLRRQLASWKQVARGGDSFGEDHEHVLQLCTKFAKFQNQTETDALRIETCQKLADSLLECGHSAAPKAHQRQQDLRAAWSEMWQLTRAQSRLLHDTETTLRVHKDLLEILPQIQEKATSLPDDVAQDRHGLQELLKAGGRVQKLCPGPQALATVQQQTVTQAWEALQLHVGQRRAWLKRALLLLRFHTAVKDSTSWVASMHQELQMEEGSWEPNSSLLRLRAHQWLRQRAIKLGQQALLATGTPTKEPYRGNVTRCSRTLKQERLQAVLQERRLLRQCDHLAELLTAQEAFLKASVLGSSVEETEQLISKHVIFQKVLALQDKKKAALREQLKTAPSPKGQNLVYQVLERRAQVKELAESRGQALHTSLMTANFTRAAAQVEDWIQEWVQQLRAWSPPGNLKDHLKHLQKHQAFMAEVQAHEQVVISVATERMVNSDDMGLNLKHCLQLCRQVRKLQATVDDTYIRRIKNLALQLKKQSPEEAETICHRQNQLNDRLQGLPHSLVMWETFHGNLLLYQQRLEAALEIHTLSSELDGITEQIREKESLIQALESTEDLENVQRLLWKQRMLQQRMGLIQTQVESLEGKVGRLCKRSPEVAHSLRHKQQEMMDSWWKVWSRAQKWRESLDVGHKAWKLQILLRGLPERALYMLQEHQACKVSCMPFSVSRTPLSFPILLLARGMGQQLLASGYQLAAVEQELSSLEKLWQRWRRQLQQAQEQQMGPQASFQPTPLSGPMISVEKVERWLDREESCLREALTERARARDHQLEELQQHRTFLQDSDEVQVATWLREKNLVALDKGQQHSTMVQTQLQKLQNFQAELDASVHQQQELQMALHLQKMLEKLESWLESLESELRGELEATVESQTRQVQELQGQAQACIQEGHCLAKGVEEQAQQLLQRFQSLQEPLQERRAALESPEPTLAVQEKLPYATAQDYGQSLSTVQHLQEKHTSLVLPPLQNLEKEISSHRTLSQVVMGTGQKLVHAGHLVQQLEAALEHKQTEASRRRRMLQQALEVQQILMEVLLRCLEATMRDLEGFRSRIERLQQTVVLLESGQNPGRYARATLLEKGSEEGVPVTEAEDAGPAWRGRAVVCAVHPSCCSPRVLSQLQAVREAHALLLQRAEDRGQALHEQLRLHQLEQETRLLDAWLAAKEAAVESQDCGQDLEGIKLPWLTAASRSPTIPGLTFFHVMEAIFGAFSREVQSLGQAKVQTLRKLMAPLERGAPRFYPPDSNPQNLVAARELQRFEQATSALQGWMQEKTALLEGPTAGPLHSSCGKGLTQGCSPYPHSSRHPSSERTVAHQGAGGPGQPEATVQEWSQKLPQATPAHTFLGHRQELLAWSQELVSSEELAGDVVGAKGFPEQHENLDQEIQECCLQAQNTWQEGQQLLTTATSCPWRCEWRVAECLQELERLLQELQVAWDLRGQGFGQSQGLQQLRQRLELAEAWLASQEGWTPAHSVTDVERMLCTHQALEKLLAAREEMLTQLQTEVKDTHVVEGLVELKQQPPAEGRQSSTSFWIRSHGTMAHRALGLSLAMREAELACVAPLMPECETGGQEACFLPKKARKPHTSIL
ncbi:Sptbn5 [Phodopus roborovskii]|uniref:Sptbn5 protein n=1 Tax=Phodopus roborovskii TaxID=109678 RepID=A0AAU9Z7K8_PHORO|nr:Sptbn5 [Phodopus roborovskii]